MYPENKFKKKIKLSFHFQKWFPSFPFFLAKSYTVAVNALIEIRNTFQPAKGWVYPHEFGSVKI